MDRGIQQIDRYLVCKNCGHYNLVSSEYLTFCEKCHKKLPNNFREWQKLNGGSFEDYLKVETTEAVQKEGSSSGNKDSWSHWINTSIVLGIILGLLIPVIPFLLPKGVISEWLSPLQQKSAGLLLNWERETYGSLGFSLESPARLKAIEANLPPDFDRVVKTTEGYRSPKVFPLGILVFSYEYAPEIRRVDLEASISGFLQQFKQMENAMDFDVTKERITLSEKQGFVQRGKFSAKGQDYKFIAVGLTERALLWQVMVTYPADNEELQQAAFRIIDSIQILYNTEI